VQPLDDLQGHTTLSLMRIQELSKPRHTVNTKAVHVLDNTHAMECSLRGLIDGGGSRNGGGPYDQALHLHCMTILVMPGCIARILPLRLWASLTSEICTGHDKL